MDGIVLESLFSRTLFERIYPEAYHEWAGYSLSPFAHMVNIWNVRQCIRHRQPMDLLTLLFELRENKTSLSLDRIYAILGLAFDQRAFVAEPNYNLSPTQLCLFMTKRFMRLTGSLDLILVNMILEPGLSSLALPSWCCPFTELDYIDFETKDPLIMVKYISGKEHRLRCGNLGVSWSTTNSNTATNSGAEWEDHVLKVQGLRLGVVANPSQLIESDSPPLMVFDSLSRLFAICSPFYEDTARLRGCVCQLLENIPIAEQTPALYRRTNIPWMDNLLGGVSGISQSLSDCLSALVSGNSVRPSSKDYVCALARRAKKEAGLEATLQPTVEEMQAVTEAVIDILHLYGESFFIDCAYVGLARSFRGLHWGHKEVWLLPGCSMPVVLEKVESEVNTDGPRYIIRSEALVDSVNIRGKRCNVTNGEAWRTATEGDLEEIGIV